MATDAGEDWRGEWISDLDRFAELRDPWNRLAGDSPFLTWDWLDCWWRAFGDDARLRVHASWDGSVLAAGIALGQRGRHAWGMSNKETDLYRPVARSPADQEPVLEALATGPWSRLTLLGLPIGDPITDRLVESLRSRGWLVDQAFRESCPIIDTRGSLEEYRARLSSNARRQLKKARRRLEREGRVEVRAVEPVAELDPVLAEGFELEAAGWKGRSRSAMLSSERSTRFWRSLFERYHALGALRWSELRLDGSLVASCLALVHGPRLYAMKTSYDERYAYFSPGHILRDAIVERCIELDFEAQELLGPIRRWKERYTTETRDTVVLRAYRRRPAPAARYLGRRWIVPRARPAYDGARRALDGVKGRRGAATD